MDKLANEILEAVTQLLNYYFYLTTQHPETAIITYLSIIIIAVLITLIQL